MIAHMIRLHDEYNMNIGYNRKIFAWFNEASYCLFMISVIHQNIDLAVRYPMPKILKLPLVVLCAQ